MTIELPVAPSAAAWTKKPTATQIGAIAEATMAAALTYHSHGRFGLFAPLQMTMGPICWSMTS